MPYYYYYYYVVWYIIAGTTAEVVPYFSVTIGIPSDSQFLNNELKVTILIDKIRTWNAYDDCRTGSVLASKETKPHPLSSCLKCVDKCVLLCYSAYDDDLSHWC